MPQRAKEARGHATTTPSEARSGVAVAGPGASLTIPGIIVSEIVRALASLTTVTRIQVDPGDRRTTGLHRAPSLAAAHDAASSSNTITYRAPDGGRLRTQSFRKWIGADIGTAIAYVWPGIDNDWVKEYVQVANAAGATSIVACASLPKSARSRAATLADALAHADLILVGDAADAKELSAELGTSGPVIETHPALSLGGRDHDSTMQKITAFLPKDNGESLATLLAAFDAIPEAWIGNYQLEVVMRFAGRVIPDLVASSYYAEHVRLIGEDISTLDLAELCSTSSVITIADPALDSRAFKTAVDFGVATVVLANALLPKVGRGYVGGLLADFDRPESVHVALFHALRLAELGFPSPDAWDELAARLLRPAEPSRTASPRRRASEGRK